jgi:hypothetical protein
MQGEIFLFLNILGIKVILITTLNDKYKTRKVNFNES